MTEIKNRWIKQNGKLHLDGWPVRIEKAPPGGFWRFLVFVEQREPVGFITLVRAKREGLEYAKELAEFID